MFNKLISGGIIKALEKTGITEPTEIQAQAIPPMLSGENVLASSETGSGKTLAFLIPILERIDPGNRNPQALILAPTKELAAQIHRVANELGEGLGIASALLIDGAGIKRQIEGLKQKPRIIIGTAPRLNEIAELRKLTVHFVKTIVLDEADRLLAAKNYGEVERLVKRTLRDTQIAAFTASVTNSAEEAFAKLLNGNPYRRIKTGKNNVIPENIAHYRVEAEHRDKIKALRKIVAEDGVKKALIFANSTFTAEEVASRLKHHGVSCAVLSSDCGNNERRAAVEDFNSGKTRFLVCTDLGARGLNFPKVSHVINYDLPGNDLDYQHRAGRTGRMGEAGVVITFTGSG